MCVQVKLIGKLTFLIPITDQRAQSATENRSLYQPARVRRQKYPTGIFSIKPPVLNKRWKETPFHSRMEKCENRGHLSVTPPSFSQSFGIYSRACNFFNFSAVVLETVYDRYLHNSSPFSKTLLTSLINSAHLQLSHLKSRSLEKRKKRKKKPCIIFRRLNFTQRILYSSLFLSFLPLPLVALIYFVVPRLRINLARLKASGIKYARMAIIETVAYTSSNWISWSSAIYRWDPFWSAPESPLGCSRLMWGTVISVSLVAYPVILTLLPFPSHYSLSSEIAQLRRFVRIDIQMAFCVHFPSFELEDLVLGESVDLPPSPVTTRTLRRARADGESLPLTQGAFTSCACTIQNRNGRFELWRGAAGVRASILIASCTVQYILLSFLLQW